MASKTRPRVYPQRPSWDVRPSDERRLVAAADQWAREHAVDDGTLPRVLGGAAWMPREVLRPEWPHALSAAEVAAAAQSVVVHTVDGRAFTAEGYETLVATPSFDYVTQGATTHHRDRRAFSGMARVRSIYRPSCVLPCPHSVRVKGHRCRTAGRLYVRTLAPYGEDGRSRTAWVRDHRGRKVGRTLSTQQGRRARWESMGYWADATITVEPSTIRDIAGCEVAQLEPGGPVVVVERGEHADAPWQRPELVRPKVRRGTRGRSIGAPVKGSKPTPDAGRKAVARTLMADPVAVAWHARILTAVELAHASGRRSTVGQGWTATYDPTAPRDQRVVIERTDGQAAPEPRNPRADATFVGSWQGRRTLARSVALATLTP